MLKTNIIFVQFLVGPLTVRYVSVIWFYITFVRVKSVMSPEVV